MRRIPVVSVNTPGQQMVVVVASAKGVAERFRRQRSNQSVFQLDSTNEMLQKIIAIGENGDSKLIDEIIGERGWTSPYCRGYNSYVDKAVGVSDYSEILFCEACMLAGLEALQKA